MTAGLAVHPTSAHAAPNEAAAAHPGEHIALVDLTPAPAGAPRVARDPIDSKLLAAIAAAGFEPVAGDRVE
ncbi:MAG TPA: hypothetical protein VFP84_18480, partial [Kofleriaceae bacterium]|nr:hypothetical protein [Kofleriaceae bacterium]